MQIALFAHSLSSDWNNGNAHFLRGVASELCELGHDVRIFEPRNAWSIRNLRLEHGEEPIRAFQAAYPELHPLAYDFDDLDVDAALRDADIVLVHEWNHPELVRRIGAHRAERGQYTLYFHDTHHRALTDPETFARFDLSHYDAVLTFGGVLQQAYAALGWSNRVFRWHEAADTKRFRRLDRGGYDGDVVWIGNFGDEERTRELEEFLIEPVAKLGLKARVYGVRYPRPVLGKLQRAGIEYGGYLPNFAAPGVYARFRLALHVPRRPYAETLVGIPTIRPFEALACEIPLLSAPWRDTERLFDVGRDFVMVHDGAQMQRAVARLLSEPAQAARLSRHGLSTILNHHTCAHRAAQLLHLTRELRAKAPRAPRRH